MRTMMALALFLSLFIPFTAIAHNPLTGSALDLRLQLFDYDEQTQLTRFHWVEEHKKYTMFEGNLQGMNPTAEGRFDIPFMYYESKKPGKRPLVIVQPSIHGLSVLETKLAKDFSEHGYNVIVSLLPDDVTDETRPTTDIDGVLIRATVASRMLMDMASMWPTIDPDRIAAAGASLGGIRTAILLGVELRVKFGVMVVAGGDLPEILTNSQNKKVLRYRYARTMLEGMITQDAYKEHLEGLLKVDPIFFAARRAPEDMFMMIGTKDTIVPTENQYKLWHAFGRPEMKEFPMNHIPTALYSTFFYRHMQKAIDHRFAELNDIDKAVDDSNENHQVDEYVVE